MVWAMKNLLYAMMAAALPFSAMADKIGDAAPALKIKEWVKGKEVDVRDGKNVYVVEFWATWCGPCKVSIPHLTEMQKNFKDKGVVFVGISDETPDKVKPFVTQMGEKMDYTVACDDQRTSNDAYMKAYGQGGIPHAFVVSKDKKVIWHGHPMADLDKALEEIVAGKYDLAAAIKKDEARAALDDYFQAAAKDDPKAKEMGQKLLESAGTDVDKLCEFAFSIGANGRIKNRDFALAEAALAKAEKAAGGKDHRVTGARSVVLFESGKKEEGLAAAKEAVELAKDDSDKKKYQNYVKVMESRLKGPATPATPKPAAK
jgi:thiol-disulfide isomerase/thioredoxin